MQLLATVEDNATPLFEAMATSYGFARENLIRNLADALTEHLRATAPVGRHYSADGTPTGGGQLRDSLFFQVGPDGASLLGAQQGVYVIGGTRAHPIAARQADELRFWWEREGRTFIGPRVRHPGSRPNDFRLKALARAFGDGTVENAAQRFWQDVTQGV